MSDSPETRQDLVRSMEELAGDVHRSLSAFHSSLVEFTTVRDSPDGIKFREYAYYSGIALICLPVLIIFFYYLGLCFGTCGDRPYEEAGLCNRGVGANLLMALPRAVLCIAHCYMPDTVVRFQHVILSTTFKQWNAYPTNPFWALMVAAALMRL
ncbi:unnamed protein product [Schistocephalus solidus]|uniref:Uncharacterized protein n=1 Tax=Schistocephalus solidus TaxID=70667 RepID=A0A3P7DGU5_SCHSO|nr:unnamed protein product [Schistocephalus solidus]